MSGRGPAGTGPVAVLVQLPLEAALEVLLALRDRGLVVAGLLHTADVLAAADLVEHAHAERDDGDRDDDADDAEDEPGDRDTAVGGGALGRPADPEDAQRDGDDTEQGADQEEPEQHGQDAEHQRGDPDAVARWGRRRSALRPPRGPGGRAVRVGGLVVALCAVGLLAVLLVTVLLLAVGLLPVRLLAVLLLTLLLPAVGLCAGVLAVGLPVVGLVLPGRLVQVVRLLRVPGLTRVRGWAAHARPLLTDAPGGPRCRRCRPAESP
ncbi:hypothetical protein [Pseudonocardia sp. HH130629-09]|uniref:hypothetical protein n=1 Tax=Pseudonocardia sp. HH130629-09 TaxID=1641402 RepID=UPI0006CB2167|nr:hypothetical protein [Pseudonocardia sp. HH130629-09]ALE83355.1 hypothetical protein XF36_09505 [Pseudonocardia sp. HH130629-09]